VITLGYLTLVMLTPHDTTFFSPPNWEGIFHFGNHYNMSAGFFTLSSILNVWTATQKRKRFSAREELALRQIPIECQFFSGLQTAYDLWCHLQNDLTSNDRPKMILTWVAVLMAFSFGGIFVNPWIAFGQAGDFLLLAFVAVSNVGHAFYIEPMFTDMTQHFRHKSEMMDMLTAILSPRTAANWHLPHLSLVKRSNAEAWMAMRLGVSTWFLLPELHHTEGLLVGLFVAELYCVAWILVSILVRWVAVLWFCVVATLALLSFILAPLFHLLVINTSVKAQVTAIHDTKVGEQLRGGFRDQADRDFLDVSLH
jgi:hypothetical protein